VIVVAVMDRQLTQVGVSEFAATAPADPWIDLEGMFPVALLAFFGVCGEPRPLSGPACSDRSLSYRVANSTSVPSLL
jgi:hypothetical protein